MKWMSAAILACCLGVLAGCGGGSGTPAVAPPAALQAFAGTPGGPAGFVDGAAADARFGCISRMQADERGSLHVVDACNAAVRTIAPSGEVSTRLAPTAFASGIAAEPGGSVVVAERSICGLRPMGCEPRAWLRRVAPSGEASLVPVTASSDGTGTALAEMIYPVAAPNGDLFLADWHASVIRRLTPQGDLTVFAGLPGQPGSVDGPPGAAALVRPDDMARDAAGNLYFPESATNVIRKVAPDGGITTLAGAQGTLAGLFDGVGSAARFDGPRAIAADPEGNVYVAEPSYHVVRKVTPAGVVTTVVGTRGMAGFVAGPLPGLLDSPQDVAVVGNDLYIALRTSVVVVRNRP